MDKPKRLPRVPGLLASDAERKEYEQLLKARNDAFGNPFHYSSAVDALRKLEEQTASYSTLAELLSTTVPTAPRVNVGPSKEELQRDRAAKEAQIQMPGLLTRNVEVLTELLKQQKEDHELAIQIAAEQKIHGSRLAAVQTLVVVGFGIIGAILTVIGIVVSAAPHH
jgi:transcriptional regulator of heat shock response